MRFSWAVAVMVAGLSLSGLAQQAPYKVKPSHEDKPAKSSAPIGKTAGGAGSASAENAKSLQNIEHQSGKMSTSSKATTKKPAALKPVKDKPNPPMNFGTTSGVKGGGKATSGSSAYKGRVRSKGGHN
jgi:hypothetical protein